MSELVCRLNPIVEELRRTRISRGVSVSDLAPRVGVQASQIYRWESGVSPRVDNLVAWTQALGLRVEVVGDRSCLGEPDDPGLKTR